MKQPTPLFQNELTLNRNTFVGLGLTLMTTPFILGASDKGVSKAILVPMRARGLVGQA